MKGKRITSIFANSSKVTKSPITKNISGENSVKCSQPSTSSNKSIVSNKPKEHSRVQSKDSRKAANVSQLSYRQLQLQPHITQNNIQSQLSNITNSITQQRKSIYRSNNHSRLGSESIIASKIQKKVVVINMAEDDTSSDEELYNSSDNLRGQVRKSIDIQFKQEKSRNTSGSLSRTSSSIQRDALIFQSLDNAKPQTYKTGLKTKQSKNHIASSIRVASQMSCESRLSQEIKEGLIRALDELNQDVRNLKAKIVDKKGKLRKIVRKIIHSIRMRKIKERYDQMIQDDQMNFRKLLSTIAIQRWFKDLRFQNKSPFRILRRVFKCKFNDGIYLGWKTRKFLKKPDIRSLVLQIKYLQTQLMYGEQLCNQRTLVELKSKLIQNMKNIQFPQPVKSKNSLDFIQRQINVSDEVLQSIESNRFDNQQIYKYLSEFDNLLPPAEKRRSHLDNHLKPVLDNYETFSRIKTQETAQFLKQQKEPNFKEDEFQKSDSLKDNQQKQQSSNDNFTDSNYNTLSTNQQEYQESTNQFCNLDYFRIDSNEMGILDIQNINFDHHEKETYNIIIENNNQLLDDTFSEKSEAFPLHFTNRYNISHSPKPTITIQQMPSLLNETQDSNNHLNNKSIDSTQQTSKTRRLQSLKRQYCKNSSTPTHTQNLFSQRYTPRLQGHYSPAKRSKIAIDMMKNVQMIQNSANKNQLIKIENKKQIVHNPNSINFKSRKDDKDDRKVKRKNAIDNLVKFYDELETKSQSLNDSSFEEDQKEELQMKLEKMFIQLRGCFNDIVNSNKK